MIDFRAIHAEREAREAAQPRETTWDADDGGPGQDYDSAYQDLCDPW